MTEEILANKYLISYVLSLGLGQYVLGDVPASSDIPLGADGFQSIDDAKKQIISGYPEHKIKGTDLVIMGIIPLPVACQLSKANKYNYLVTYQMATRQLNFTFGNIDIATNKLFGTDNFEDVNQLKKIIAKKHPELGATEKSVIVISIVPLPVLSPIN